MCELRIYRAHFETMSLCIGVSYMFQGGFSACLLLLLLFVVVWLSFATITLNMHLLFNVQHAPALQIITHCMLWHTYSMWFQCMKVIVDKQSVLADLLIILSSLVQYRHNEHYACTIPLLQTAIQVLDAVYEYPRLLDYSLS